MSRLKISDLSFCETELPSDSQVQGGFGFSFSFYFHKRKPFARIKNPNADYTTNYFGGEKTVKYKYLVSDHLGNVAGAEFGTLENGGIYSSSFAMSGNFVPDSTT